EDGFLEGLRDGEADLLACRNLDRLARLRVAPHARLHLAKPEDPESGDFHVLAFFHALRDRLDQTVQQLVDLLAAHLAALGKLRHQLRLRHPSTSVRAARNWEKNAAILTARPWRVS